MSQLNLAADFTVTIYRDVSAWKTETGLTLTGNTEFGGGEEIKASRQSLKCFVHLVTVHTSIYNGFYLFLSIIACIGYSLITHIYWIRALRLTHSLSRT